MPLVFTGPPGLPAFPLPLSALSSFPLPLLPLPLPLSSLPLPMFFSTCLGASSLGSALAVVGNASAAPATETASRYAQHRRRKVRDMTSHSHESLSGSMAPSGHFGATAHHGTGRVGTSLSRG